LVAEAFLHKPDGDNYTVDHTERNPSDNRLEKLRWATPAEQAANRDMSTRKPRRRAVWKIDPRTGKKLKKYDQIKEAALDVGLKDPTGISNVCYGKQQTAGGFKWEYADTEELDGETWKSVPDQPGFEASSFGRIRYPYGRITEGFTVTNGYQRVGIGKKSRGVHQLVASAFFGPPDDPEKNTVNHQNREKKDNYVENLEHASMADQVRHVVATGRNDFKRAVSQLSLDGKVVAIFKSQKEAEEMTDISRSKICNVCRGNQKTAGGFRWEYVDETQVEYAPRSPPKVTKLGKRRVRQLSLDGEHIAEFESLTEAAKAVGGSKSSIWTAVKKRKTSFHYRWEYADGKGNMSQKKPIEQLTLYGEYLSMFESLAAAARQVSVAPSEIWLVCNNRRHTCKGFKWRYKPEDAKTSDN